MPEVVSGGPLSVCQAAPQSGPPEVSTPPFDLKFLWEAFFSAIFWQNFKSIFANNLAPEHRTAKILVYLESLEPKEHSPVVGTFWPEEISKAGFFRGTNSGTVWHAGKIMAQISFLFREELIHVS